MPVDGTREAHPDRVGERRAQQARLWLGAGAMTLGMGAAMLGGAAIAAADSDAPSGPTRTGSTDSSDSSSSDAGSSSAGPVKSSGGSSRETVGSSSGDSADSTGLHANDDSDEAGDSDDSWGAASPTRGSGLDDDDVTSEETTEAIGGAEEAVSEEVISEETVTEEVVDEDGPVGTGGAHGPTSTPQAPATNSPVISDSSSTATSPTPDTDTTPLATPAVTDSGLSTIAGSAGASFYTLASTSSTVGRAAALSPAAVPAAAVAQASNPFGLPTPEELLRGLQELGTNLYFAVMNQLYGFQRSLTALRDDVIGILGFTQEVITRSLPFGNPTGNAQYFVQSGDFLSAGLATVAMAYAQLTGSPVDLAGFLAKAANTPSLRVPGTMVYLGPGARLVYWTDTYEVLQDKDVRIIMRSYGTNQADKAYNDLTNGLTDPTKAMIVPINGPVSDSSDVKEKTVVVIGVDNVNGTVTINDPTRADGQGLVMSYDDFMDAWGSKKYQLITTQLASSPNVAPDASETRWVWSLPSIQQIGSRVAAAFVHQVQVFQENITYLTDDLSRTFGVSQPEPIGPPSAGDVEYGNYLQNYQYWRYQGQTGTCALMSTAAVIAQLTANGMPVDMDALAAEVQQLAETLPSGIKVGEPIYTEGKGGTFSSDVITLLNRFGINADYTTYLKNEGSLALDNMTAALEQGQSVIVSVNNKLIYDAWNTQYFGAGREWYRGTTDQPNHAVTVLSVNMTKGVVYINDSAPRQGQGLAVPLDQFMKAWETGNFSLTTAERDSSAAG
ncbi:hypothetical protein O6072_18495 [Mycolicibacterium neoaurum]|uniref:hypothetical protein n=1 Tax=Mycolicibacterium neoaurum TaxID=1795 RepID=UPI00248C74BE|nr:hypothetical protein [Mycolicibacterium neoaurum]WBP93188.1 hypothetical protein O7W24_18750 [Mycolicibacterium neoaurum]WBS06845.1 hypothetical protein O6072_18495 [Mycolicibacterium neoaurum]